mgnify:CR=1 FL=1
MIMPRSSFASERTNKTMDDKKMVEANEFYHLNNSQNVGRRNVSKTLTRSMLGEDDVLSTS